MENEKQKSPIFYYFVTTRPIWKFALKAIKTQMTQIKTDLKDYLWKNKIQQIQQIQQICVQFYLWVSCYLNSKKDIN